MAFYEKYFSMLKDKRLSYIFIALVLIFITMLILSFIEITSFFVIVFLAVTFAVLGVFLVWLTLKSKIKGKLRTYFLITGASATGILVFSIN